MELKANPWSEWNSIWGWVLHSQNSRGSIQSIPHHPTLVWQEWGRLLSVILPYTNNEQSCNEWWMFPPPCSASCTATPKHTATNSNYIEFLQLQAAASIHTVMSWQIRLEYYSKSINVDYAVIRSLGGEGGTRLASLGGWDMRMFCTSVVDDRTRHRMLSVRSIGKIECIKTISINYTWCHKERC